MALGRVRRTAASLGISGMVATLPERRQHVGQCVHLHAQAVKAALHQTLVQLVMSAGALTAWATPPDAGANARQALRKMATVQSVCLVQKDATHAQNSILVSVIPATVATCIKMALATNAPADMCGVSPKDGTVKVVLATAVQNQLLVAQQARTGLVLVAVVAVRSTLSTSELVAAGSVSNMWLFLW